MTRGLEPEPEAVRAVEAGRRERGAAELNARDLQGTRYQTQWVGSLNVTPEKSEVRGVAASKADAARPSTDGSNGRPATPTNSISRGERKGDDGAPQRRLPVEDLIPHFNPPRRASMRSHERLSFAGRSRICVSHWTRRASSPGSEGLSRRHAEKRNGADCSRFANWHSWLA